MPIRSEDPTEVFSQEALINALEHGGGIALLMIVTQSSNLPEQSVLADKMELSLEPKKQAALARILSARQQEQSSSED